MADGWSAATANAFLAAVFQGTAYAATAVWVQLHTAAPGAAGTSNIATNNVRADATTKFTTAPSGGSITNTANIGVTEWATVPASETYTHATLWDDPTTGTFLGSGTLSVPAVTAGSAFQLNTGAVTASVPVAA